MDLRSALGNADGFFLLAVADQVLPVDYDVTAAFRGGQGGL